MRKVLASLLALLLCLSLSVTAFAADGAESGTSDNPGVILEVDTEDGLTVELVAGTEVTDGVVTITYDTTQLSISGEDQVEPGDDITMYSVNAEEDGVLKISWISEDPASPSDVLFDLGFVSQGEEIYADAILSFTGSVLTEDGTAVDLEIVTDAPENPDSGSEESQVDKSLLQELYDAGLGLTEDLYTPESWANFTQAMTAAKAVLEDENATQEDVDLQRSALLSAMTALVPVQGDTEGTGDTGNTGDTGDAGDTQDSQGDREVLEALDQAAENLDESKYTPESWEALQEVLEQVRKVLNDPDATDEEIQQALDSLQQAIENLELAQGGSAKTGDFAPVLVVSVVALVALAALAVVFLNRRRVRK